MDTSIEWNIRRHWPKKIYLRTPHGRKRGRPQQSRKNLVTNFMRSRNMEDMAENSHFWLLRMDRGLLAV